MIEPSCDLLFQYLCQPEIYYPLLIVGCCLALAFILSHFVNRYAQAERLSDRIRSLHNFNDLFQRVKFLTFPFLSYVLFSIGALLSYKLLGDKNVVKIFAQLATVWLMLSLIWVLTSNRSITTLMAIVAVTIGLLNFYGLLTPTILFLDSLALHMGSRSISLYLLIKGGLVLLLLLVVTKKVLAVGKRYIWRLKEVNLSTRDWLFKLFQIVLYFFVLLIVLDLMGFSLTSLTIFTSAIVVGIGFATQKIASNFISGVILLFEKTVELDDVLELKDGTWAWVRRLGVRATLLEAFDGREIIVPNEEFITQSLTNLSYSHHKVRLTINVRVSYTADLEKARQLMLEAARLTPSISRDPKPECFLTQFHETAAIFQLQVWLDDVSRGKLRPQSEVMFSVWNKFRENGIDFPLPSSDVHIKSGILEPAASLSHLATVLPRNYSESHRPS